METKKSTILQPYSKEALYPPGTLFYPDLITITGSSASGKSTLVKLTLDELEKTKKPGEPGYPFHSAGKYKRDLAKEKGFLTPNGEGDIKKFTDWEKENPQFDFDSACDQRSREFGLRGRGIAEGRLVRLFMFGFNVLLICSPAVCAARRAIELSRQWSREVTPVQALIMIQQRDENDKIRYAEKYPGYDWKLDDYDLVIDNNVTKKEDLAHILLSARAKWLEEKKRQGLLVPKLKIAKITSSIRTRATV